jgi:uncharacterized protein
MMSLYVGRTDVGLGLFAGRPFARGEPLSRLEGPVIDFARTTRMGPDEAHPIQVARDRYIAATGFGRYLNHSCEPNAGFRGLTLVALDEVTRHEEIRFDYSTTMAEDRWTMTCRCGAACCRGVVRDFRHLPAALRRKYIDLGVAPPHVWCDGARVGESNSSGIGAFASDAPAALILQPAGGAPCPEARSSAANR